MASLLGGISPWALAAQPSAEALVPAAVPSRTGAANSATTDNNTRPLKPATAEQRPPIPIGLRADEQGFDQLLDRFVARGDVQIELAGGRLLADRLEYETKTRTLVISGRVRFWRGEQYFQANSLRYSLSENRGDADAVYGVIDFDTTQVDFDLEVAPTIGPPPLSYWPRSTAFRNNLFQLDAGSLWSQTGTALAANPVLRPGSRGLLPGLSSSIRLGPTATKGRPAPLRLRDWRTPPVVLLPAARTMACPPLIPTIPNWHPYPTAITAWGYGQAIDANFGDAFYFQGRMRPEYLWGFNVNQRLIDAGPLALEFDSNALLHTANWQRGGPYNNTYPNAPLPPQTFGEFTGGLGLRAWLQPWLSVGFVQGVSILTANSLYEQTFRGSYQTFLNYLAFEVEALVQPQWSVVGRLHHRSGAYGTYGGVSEGSNAYLVGVRYRFGYAPPSNVAPDMPPPQSCPGAPPPGSKPLKPLDEQLNQVAQGPTKQALGQGQSTSPVREPLRNPAEEERERHLAIAAAVDQRVSDVRFIRSLKLERRQGGLKYDQTAEERQFGQGRPQQLMGFYGDQKLVDGQVGRWRFQAERITITPEGWQAERAAFTNDPFTPAQSWLDLQQVTAVNMGEGTIKVNAKRSRLILENRLPIPMRRNLTLEKKKPVDNRFVVADDSIDRSGIYFGYKLRDINIPNTKAKLKLEPQFMVARALNGSVSTYPSPGASAGSPNITQTAQIGDLFGAFAKVEGSIFGFATSDFAVSLSTLNPNNFANGTRSWGDFSRTLKLPNLGILPAGEYTSRFYGAYRYRSFNGSLGYQDVYSAVGASLEKSGPLKPWGKLTSRYFWRASFGNYQGNQFNTSNNTSVSSIIGDTTRTSFYGAVNNSIPIWVGKPKDSVDPRNTQNTPSPVTPGLTLNTVTSTSLDYYGNGSNQSLVNFSSGPTLTLGSFTKNFFDYTQFTIIAGGTLQQGKSPFSFDRNVDLATLGIGWTQQLFGPLMFNLGLGYNIDPSSPYFGYTTNAFGELRWQRRGYEFGIYYSPYEQVGGLRIKLNDFNFNGTGVPFVPTAPINPTRNRQSLF